SVRWRSAARSHASPRTWRAFGVIDVITLSGAMKQNTVLLCSCIARSSTAAPGRTQVRMRGRTRIAIIATAIVARVPSEVSTDASPPSNELNTLIAGASSGVELRVVPGSITNLWMWSARTQGARMHLVCDLHPQKSVVQQKKVIEQEGLCSVGGT